MSDLGNIFLPRTLKVQATKAKINKWDYIELIRFCTTKETTNKMKRQSIEWEKIFANHIYPIKGYSPKYIRNLYNSKANKTKQNKSKNKQKD